MKIRSAELPNENEIESYYQNKQLKSMNFNQNDSNLSSISNSPIPSNIPLPLQIHQNIDLSTQNCILCDDISLLKKDQLVECITCHKFTHTFCFGKLL